MLQQRYIDPAVGELSLESVAAVLTRLSIELHVISAFAMPAWKKPLLAVTCTVSSTAQVYVDSQIS